MNTKVFALLKRAAVLIGVVAAMFTGTATAQADEQGYIDMLTYQYSWVIWDYPGVVIQGHVVCTLLYRGVNPMVWLTTGPQYDPGAAADIITAAKVTMCPYAAVTA